MHHKRLLSGPFRVGARRSPCVQTLLCPPTSPGPRAPGPPAAEHASPWESQHMCWGEAGGAGGGEWGPPGPPPARPPARPTSVHRTQRVERMGCHGVQTLAEIRRPGGVGPSLGLGGQRPVVSPKAHRRHRTQKHCTSTVPLAPGCLEPSAAKSWGVTSTHGSPDFDSGRLVRSIN